MRIQPEKAKKKVKFIDAIKMQNFWENLNIEISGIYLLNAHQTPILDSIPLIDVHRRTEIQICTCNLPTSSSYPQDANICVSPYFYPKNTLERIRRVLSECHERNMKYRTLRIFVETFLKTNPRKRFRITIFFRCKKLIRRRILAPANAPNCYLSLTDYFRAKQWPIHWTRDTREKANSAACIGKGKIRRSSGPYVVLVMTNTGHSADW